MDKVGMLSSFIDHDDFVLRRQDLPKLYAPNGAVYVMNVHFLKNEKSLLAPGTVGVVMPDRRSIDVDTEFDLEICDFLLRKELGKNKQISPC